MEVISKREENNKGGSWTSILSGLKLFGIQTLDIVVIFAVTYIMEGRNFFSIGGLSKVQGSTITVRFIIIILLWAVFIYGHYRWAKSKDLFGLKIISVSKTPVFICAAFVIPIVLVFFMNGEIALSVPYQFNFFARNYGQIFGGIVNTVLQYVYWLLESMLAIFIIDSFQRAGESISHNTFVPWGGIGLALTWGTGHLLTSSAAFLNVLILSLLAGIFYILCRKSFIPVLVYFIVISFLQ